MKSPRAFEDLSDTFPLLRSHQTVLLIAKTGAVRLATCCANRLPECD